MIVRLVRRTQFRPTTWRCRICGFQSAFKLRLCEPVEVRL
ncbi:hypothetical protein LCGC14_1832320 [marine sediment metagenome]|uniref:Uncharacterized protein n=1 Tax=marine sediment metagenome TaxID=412755 RepID=A0A0F9JF79_9ZZZZ